MKDLILVLSILCMISAVGLVICSLDGSVKLTKIMAACESDHIFTIGDNRYWCTMANTYGEQND